MSNQASPDRLVGAWLWLLVALVAIMVLVGGATRLTDSGLSITEWNFAKHFLPPLTQAGWEKEFALYQRTTEYQVQNSAMALGEFRYIYFWEWGHRFLGQMIGLVFALPFFAFLAMGRLRGRVLPVLGFGLLGGLQGFVGWWMVTSGLYGRLDVSAVRLAIHLGVAFALLGYGATLAMATLGRPAARSEGGPSQGLIWGLAVLLYLQILFGALMAGTDAGRAFGDWPTVGGEWFPGNTGQYRPGWTNFTENLALVQFNHRLAGYLFFAAALGLGWRALRAGGPGRRVALHVVALSSVQIILGISTILLGAPLWISLIHQSAAVVLWLAVVWWARVAPLR